ncbi:MAG: 50S ribosomal protein L20 [Candidatus Omnitrophica bacterium]|nr:50S ribosomal protein L20 [Candidatus Omnitrophota bacterium]
MTRVTNAVASRKRKKRVLKQAKGQFGHRSKRYQQADRSVTKGMAYSYRDRRVKKREIRSLWIVRINAACRDAGLTYSRFIKGLKEANIEVNRQMLAELAVNSAVALKKLIKIAQESVTVKPVPKTTKKV